MLNCMTELAGQAANGIYQNEVDRENATKELDSLRSESDCISNNTNLNGIKLLDGTLGGGVGAAGVIGGANLTFKGVRN